MTVHACFTLYAASMTTVGEKVMFDQTQIGQREGLALLNKFNLSPSAVPIEYITSRDSDLGLTVGFTAWWSLGLIFTPRPLMCCFLT